MDKIIEKSEDVIHPECRSKLNMSKTIVIFKKKKLLKKNMKLKKYKKNLDVFLISFLSSLHVRLMVL